MNLRRRFVYLITADKNRRDFLLRRIDTPSLFFAPKDDRPAHPPPLEEARLPCPVFRFNAAAPDPGDGNMEFMLFSGGGRKRGMVVATDPEGRAVLVDPDRRAVRLLPDLTKPKTGPISFTVGSVLYILGTMPRAGILRTLCFDCLVFNDDERGGCHDGWCGRLSLPAPPYESTWWGRSNGYEYDSFEETKANVTASALVPGDGGGTILVSKRTLGTHAFDVARGAWSKAGDWALPFYGRAHLVPEHGVWLGLSSLRGGDGRGRVPRDCDDGLVCASELAAAAPPTTPRDLWRDRTPPGWASRESCLVDLGCCRFCLARFFDSRRPDGELQRFVVFTGIEVERAAGGELSVMKHRSRRYSYDGDHKAQRVL
ncbi:unnamed protein product [Urochloa decumbens]|uniref:Uncharacterized protein n=1 Tax=Urochloa decumbens TaxID=240449 RepID=A0ABC9DZ45_9POAL